MKSIFFKIGFCFLLSFHFLYFIPETTGQNFDLNKIQNLNSAIATWEKGEGFQQQILKIKPSAENKNLLIWKKDDAGDFKNNKYLICEIWHKSNFSGVVRINFFQENSGPKKIEDQGSAIGSANEKPRISAKIGVLPSLPTRIVFPLSHLDGQEIFLHRFPRQLKGTVTGNRLLPGNILKIEIEFGPVMEPDFLPVFEIASIYLCDEFPEPLPKPLKPVVDQFGQWTARDWTGKIRSENQLKKVLENQLKASVHYNFPSGWSRFGGWLEKKFDATGFFRTHNDGTRWWLVDPEGYAFVSVGVDCIGNNASGSVTGQEDLFEWLPAADDEKFRAAFTQRGSSGMMDFYRSNFIRVFDENWKTSWEKITAGQIRSYGLNTIANWSDIDFCRKAKIPYVLPLNNFPGTRKMLYRDFPDVYSPEYRQNSERFAAQLAGFRDDPYLIGYFLRNEPHWAFGSNNIAFEMFGDSVQSYSKDEFIKWLATNYGSIADFNTAWNLDLTGFNHLAGKILYRYPSAKAESDFWKFSELLVAQYVNVPCDEVEKVDPNHLNLGMRYAWMSSELLYKAGERFDVFSINGYSNPGPPETAEIARRSGKPVMIGEFHFGAVDKGLPASGIQGAITQHERGTAYRYYVEQGLARPELIGIHYFQWLDQPVFGRFDGENYNIGFMDICNQPYGELIDAARETHKRMYRVAAGSEKPFDAMIKKVPGIYY